MSQMARIVVLALTAGWIAVCNCENLTVAPAVPLPPASPLPTPPQLPPPLPSIPTPPSELPHHKKPPTEEWTYVASNKFKLFDWLMYGCWPKDSPMCQNKSVQYQEREYEYEGYDGFYNNPAHPDLGAVDTPLLRRLPAAYEDGVYKPSGWDRPEPLRLSETLMYGASGTSSHTGRTALLLFFGQQVVEEILDAQRPACPPEYFNINITAGHEYANMTNHTQIPFLRTRYDMRTGFSPNNPRQQLNEITPWIDGGLVYGTTKTWADQLRTFPNRTMAPDGKLASSEDGLYPANNTVRLPMANPPPPFLHHQFIQQHETLEVSRFFMLGNPRGNENPFLLTFGVLWFRWHNHIASYLKLQHPEWKSEKLFNEARKWVIATQQHITVNEWLPEWLGKSLDDYKGYDPSIDPQIDQLFQSAAFRFGHTLVPPGVYVRDYGRNGCNTLQPEKAVRTCNSYWRPQDIILRKTNNGTVGIERLLMGMAFQVTEREDNQIVEDLRGRVFGPLEFPRRDLMALNIQRGRDHGLPDYNTVRRAFKLEEINDVNKFTTLSEKERQNFLALHNHAWNNIDLWVGGLLETTPDGPGELFTAIILDQFRRIRDGDRFWYKNTENGLFTQDEVRRIESLTIYDIIMSVTDMEHNDIQQNPFRAPTNLNRLHEQCQRKLHKGRCAEKSCWILPQLSASHLENCSPPGIYDYFEGSMLSFILTYSAVGFLILVFVAILLMLVYIKEKRQVLKSERIASKARESLRRDNTFIMPFSAQERVGHRTSLRPVVLLLDVTSKQVQVHDQRGKLLRAIDLTHRNLIEIYIITDGQHIMLKVSNDYDLVLKFVSEYLRDSFLQAFEQFLTSVNIARQRVNISLGPALKQAVTREDRQKRLEMFFRVVFSQAFNISHSEEELLKLDARAAREIIYTELTINEFAEALSMRPDSGFVCKMFALVDKDKNGFISFREFVDMLIIFAKGTAEEKAKLMFDMYDINNTGKLTREDFKNMLKSLTETVNAEVEQDNLDSVVNSMMTSAGLANKEAMGLEDFKRLLLDHQDKLNYADLSFPGVQASRPHQKISRRSSFAEYARETASTLYGNPNPDTSSKTKLAAEQSVDADQEIALQRKEPQKQKQNPLLPLMRVIENYAREIFWTMLYTLVLIAIFAERAYYYSVEREHSGLRRIAGYGVTVTRGAASAMMFAYSSLLVTMCRNTITMLRDTFLHVYFPFDAAVWLHKYMAVWALIFTVMHVIGHAFNFYSISTQTSDDLTCLFRNYHHSTHEIPKFHYWCWQTVTGITGVLLTLLTALIFIFATPFARKHLYASFWLTHSLYPVFYILMILHGAGRLIQEPFFHYFFLGPCILFTLDRLISVTRKKIEIPVMKAELLPSNVTMLEFKRPNSFEYKSGQWVRIACPALNTSEYHPFTLSSAPNEKNLTVHIRAVGPWTTNIRNLYDPNVLREKPLPKIHLDGPYGEGHQDWYQFDIAVLIGGGIGVTPFASILKDIVSRANHNQITCKKVYFLWVTKTQKRFEWLVDIIREVENTDKRKVVSVHIFITQFYQKFDLRTILLYICERHFQRVSNRSLFTGLTAVTHFGRPNFSQFFSSLQGIHPKVRKVGVFSCGPPPMTATVDNACVKINKETAVGPIFQHHYKNF